MAVKNEVVKAIEDRNTWKSNFLTSLGRDTTQRHLTVQEVSRDIRLYASSIDVDINKKNYRWLAVKEVIVKTGACVWLGPRGCLIDLPGGQETNPIRQRIHERYLREVDYVYVVVEAKRAGSDVSPTAYLEKRSELVADGRYESMKFIVTKCDQIDPEELEEAYPGIDFSHPDKVHDFIRSRLQVNINGMLKLSSGQRPFDVFLTQKGDQESYTTVRNDIIKVIEDIDLQRQKILDDCYQDVVNTTKALLGGSQVVLDDREVNCRLKRLKQRVDSLLQLKEPEYLYDTINKIPQTVDISGAVEDKLEVVRHWKTMHKLMILDGEWAVNINQAIQQKVYENICDEWDTYFNQTVNALGKIRTRTQLWEAVSTDLNDVMILNEGVLTLHMTTIQEELRRIHVKQVKQRGVLRRIIREKLGCVYLVGARERGTGMTARIRAKIPGMCPNALIKFEQELVTFVEETTCYLRLRLDKLVKGMIEDLRQRLSAVSASTQEARDVLTVLESSLMSDM